MLHYKLQGHRPTGSGEEDVLNFLPNVGLAAMLVMTPLEQFLVLPIPGDYT